MKQEFVYIKMINLYFGFPYFLSWLMVVNWEIHVLILIIILYANFLI